MPPQKEANKNNDSSILIKYLQQKYDDPNKKYTLKSHTSHE